MFTQFMACVSHDICAKLARNLGARSMHFSKEIWGALLRNSRLPQATRACDEVRPRCSLRASRRSPCHACCVECCVLFLSNDFSYARALRCVFCKNSRFARRRAHPNLRVGLDRLDFVWASERRPAGSPRHAPAGCRTRYSRLDDARGTHHGRLHLRGLPQQYRGHRLQIACALSKWASILP
jgi:hypothetical protein